MSNQKKNLTKTTKASSISGMTGRTKYISHISGASVSRQATHFTVRLGQMKYTKHMKSPTALARGKYKGYSFLVLNMGLFPTAYVCVPAWHRYFGWHYGRVNSEDFVKVHGEFTYSDKTVAKSTITDSWWLGWDYGHIGLGDYMPALSDEPFLDEPKHWTREEVITEIKAVIDQLDKVK